MDAILAVLIVVFWILQIFFAMSTKDREMWGLQKGWFYFWIFVPVLPIYVFMIRTVAVTGHRMTVIMT